MAITIYLMNVNQLDPDDLRWRGHVSEKRYMKMQKYVQRKDRTLSLGVELLLNHGLQELYPQIEGPVTCWEDEYGKLYLPDHPHVHFNLAHAQDYVVCAMADVAVGVDIEYGSDIDLHTAHSYFTGQEYAYILEKPDSERLTAFYELWTLKESYMKATGLGFQLAMEAFSVQMGEEITVVQDGKTQPYIFYHIQFEKYHLAVCYQGTKTESIAPILCEPSGGELRIVSYGVL